MMCPATGWSDTRRVSHLTFSMPGQAKLVPAGSDIVLEVHYMPEGKATTDQSSVGLVFAKEPPKERVMTLSAVNETFKIPPGDPNYRVDSSFTVRHEVTLLGMHPHMHTRGKDMAFRLVFPNGETRTILNVPHYNWHWQLWYNLAKPITLPRAPGSSAPHITTTPRTIRKIRIRPRQSSGDSRASTK